jgi:4-amino-4-deoxy-L-arabinose transferase-like glycosyltransferase
MTSSLYPSGAHKPFLLLTIFYISAMFLPRLTPQGMFGDGLLYASISRNLSEGHGSWWAPFFSYGYWLNEVSSESYVENPPLMFWIQSLFFQALGDHWWVEKLFSLLILVTNCFLISRVWELGLKTRSSVEGNLAWLPVWFFYLIPIVVWGSPNNLIDPLLLTFSLIAIWSSLAALRYNRMSFLLFSLTILFIFLGILTKGPVALFPVAVPFLYCAIVERKDIWKGFVLSCILLMAAIGLFSLFLLWNEAARFFFIQYWQQRLSVAIAGGRADGLRTGWMRLYIFWLLLRENSLILGVSFLLILFAWKQSIASRAYVHERKLALFFLALGLAATVPVMMSTRQAGMYLIPGLALFAISAGYFHLPLIWHWLNHMSLFVRRSINIMAGIGILAVFIYSAFLFGKSGRETSLLHDSSHLEQFIPDGAQVAVCDEVMHNFVYHVYLQRFQHIKLTRNLTGSHYYLTDLNCCGSDHGYDLLYSGELLNVYRVENQQ